MKKILAVLLSLSLAACGGGGEDGEDPYFLDLTSYDEYSAPVETYKPPSNQPSFFPLALHFRTITKSYVSKVGTTSIREYIISGKMTTPSVSNGNYSAKSTTTLRYLGPALFEGVSVTPVTSESRRYNIKLNDVALADQTSTSTSYYDTTYGFFVGSSGSYYRVLDSASPLPEIALAGESGNFLTYKAYSDSSKATVLGFEVSSYKVLTVSTGNSGEYKARVEYTVRRYSSQGQLLSLQTSTNDEVYSLQKGAGSSNVSLYVDDVSGTTTSRLLFTRVR